jgi:hypothetical protein
VAPQRARRPRYIEEKIGKKWKKDTILTEQSYRPIQNKGLNILKGSKQTGF